MPRPAILLLMWLFSSVSGCGPASETPDSGALPPDWEALKRQVVLTAGPLHLEPDSTSPGVLDVQAGAILERVLEGPDVPGWVRVATWDDRRGWIPASRLMGQSQWAHYAEALGGVAPVLVRVAYPVEGGVWAVEAPLGTPGITPASTAWLVGDSAMGTRVTAIDSLEDVCSGELHRFGILDTRFSGGNLPRLEEGRLVTPSGERPTIRRLAVGPLDPDADLVALLDTVAAARAPRETAGAPPTIEWLSIGDEFAWAALSWPAEDPSTGGGQVGVAGVFRRSAGGWEQVATLGPAPSSAEIPTPAWRPVAVYAVGPSGSPAVLLLEALEYEGAHLDIWIERGGRYERIYEGYYWGC